VLMAVAGFDEYFTSLTPLSYTRNPWFVEFWEKFFECKYVGDSATRLRHAKTCTGLTRCCFDIHFFV